MINEDGSTRKPLALAIALDSSGSMNGLKLRTCKEAISKVINGCVAIFFPCLLFFLNKNFSLKEGDILHVVEYGTHSRIVFANVFFSFPFLYI